MEKNKKPPKNYSPEVRVRAVRMLLEHRANYENQWHDHYGRFELDMNARLSIEAKAA